MLTTAERDVILDLYDTGHYVGWLTAITDWRAGTVTECNYTGYTRVSITAMDAAENTSPTGGRQRKNTSALTGGQNTGTSQDAIGWGIFAASTGGSPKWIGLLDSDDPIYGTCTSASPGVITAYSHGLVVDQRVFYLSAPGAVTPTGISENTAYFVGTAPTGDTFTLSTTASNANPVNTTGDGAGLFCPYTALTIANNATPEFAAGALILQI